MESFHAGNGSYIWPYNICLHVWAKARDMNGGLIVNWLLYIVFNWSS